MEKCVIFGAGYMGSGAYTKLKNYYDVLAFIDNNQDLHNKKKYHKPILSVDYLKEFVKDKNGKIFVCTDYYYEIAEQLYDMGITSFFVMLGGFLFYYDEQRMMMPCELSEMKPYIKEKPDDKAILFAQTVACIRTHKFAELLKQAGYHVFLLYTIAAPEDNHKEYDDTYEKIYTPFTLNQLVEFVNNSDFDLIHSSNGPDYLTNLLLLSNKKVIHDTHDMASLYRTISTVALVEEFLANTQSAGVIYTSEGVRKIAGDKFGDKGRDSFAIGNMPVDRILIEKYHEKLSMKDGEVHCVYEGSIAPGGEGFRNFESIWQKIAKEGIHIHYYSHLRQEYCKWLERQNEFFHYEGDLGSQQLAEEMTKYDCGLAIFNHSEKNKTFLETGSANKMFEYLNAGIPVVVGSISSYVEFVEKYKAGACLDLNGDIRTQIQKISEIKISPDFLRDNHLTMKSQLDNILKYYEHIIHSEA